MNTPVSFELAKLLKEKGFDIPCGQFYAERILDDDEVIKDNLCQRRDFGIYAIQITNYNLSYEYAGEQVNEGCYLAPTIAEVVMWLYEKHGIWIWVWMWMWMPNGKEQLFDYGIKQMRLGLIDIPKKPEEFNSPTEAYEAAIEYCLTKLI